MISPSIAASIDVVSDSEEDDPSVLTSSRIQKRLDHGLDVVSVWRVEGREMLSKYRWYLGQRRVVVCFLMCSFSC